MRVYKKIVKECETDKGVKELVLFLYYSHKGEKWEVIVRNYDERLYEKIRKTLALEIETLLADKQKKLEELISTIKETE